MRAFSLIVVLVALAALGRAELILEASLDEDDDQVVIAPAVQHRDPALEVSVADRDLVVKGISAASILKHHSYYDKDTAHVKQTHDAARTLAYVTPWNNHGYDVAKMFRGKFTHLSPVWYSVKPDDDSIAGYSLHGAHDCDQGWIKEVTEPVKETGVKPKIVPRFQLSDFRREDVIALAEEADLKIAKAITNIIVRECRHQRFDGFVLEFLVAAHTPGFIRHLSKQARDSNLEFFL
ncbi:Chitinase domain-containing protein 1, partial [Irineochytrium annulatum]